tara:strand:- start:630 stop:1517 length:888 start_codon:yes stop_codon:yes gene_type:complete
MKYLITILIFFLVLFIYLHVQYHLKTSDDLEVYTVEKPSKEKLEEICDIRQPVIIPMDISEVKSNCNILKLDDNYGAFDIKIRSNDFNDDNKELYLPFLLSEALQIFQKNDNSKKNIITEANEDFLKETGVIKYYKYNDGFLRPKGVSKCIYDFWCGNNNSTTPLRYLNNYRNFFYVTHGKCKIKLIPPKYSKYLHIKKDFENGEFISPIDPWVVQDEYKSDFNKVKVLDITLDEGYVLYIPAYWLFSIKYENISSLSIFCYRTYMNTVSIIPDLTMQFLQEQNVKHKFLKSLLH